MVIRCEAPGTFGPTPMLVYIYRGRRGGRNVFTALAFAGSALVAVIYVAILIMVVHSKVGPKAERKRRSKTERSPLAAIDPG